VRRGLALLALALGAALSTGGAAVDAGTGTSKDPTGDVQAAGLTQAERDAMDITSVQVTGTDSLGVFVKVTFKGDIEQSIGRGQLAGAAVALVLQADPKKGLSAGLVSEGPGKLGTLRRESRSTRVGAFREGNTLTFFILGPGFGSVKKVEVETVLKTGELGKLASVRSAPPYLGPRIWDKFLTLNPLDFHVQTADASGLSCPELQNLLRSIDQDLGDPYFAQTVSAPVVQALDAFRATVKGLVDKCGGSVRSSVDVMLAWTFFDPTEVKGTGKVTGPAERFDELRVVLPEAFKITNFICPAQLPKPTVTGNQLDCGGGILATGDPFTLNLQTNPNPSTGMGGGIYVESSSGSSGPFAVKGP
jgi:hypothetical protein